MKRFITAILLISLVWACSAPKKLVAPKKEETTGSSYDESFDPLSIHDDDITINSNAPSPAAVTNGGKSDNKSLPKEAATVLKESDGFRVQILATRSIETATLVKQKAEEQFKTYNYKVYWQFEAPFYKIRIGDALKRTEAEQIRDLAKELGYDQAFPVRSKVKVSNRSY